MFSLPFDLGLSVDLSKKYVYSFTFFCVLLIFVVGLNVKNLAAKNVVLSSQDWALSEKNLALAGENLSQMRRFFVS